MSMSLLQEEGKGRRGGLVVYIVEKDGLKVCVL